MPDDNEPLRKGRMLRCPWCNVWQPQESFIVLQVPEHPDTVPIYKHGGSDGCKSLFAIAEEA